MRLILTITLLIICLQVIGCSADRRDSELRKLDEKFLFPFQKDGKYGYKNLNGKEVIPPKFDSAKAFRRGYGEVMIKGDRFNKRGLVDYNGNYLIQPGKYYIYWSELNNLYILSPFGHGPFFYPPGHHPHGYPGRFSYTYLDESFKEINPEFVIERKCGQDLLLVRKTDSEPPRYGLWDKSHKIVLPFEYTEIRYLYRSSPSLIKNLDNKYGYINKEGKIVIEPVYECAQRFSCERAAVWVDGKWGYIDPSGEMVIPPFIDTPGDFVSDRALVWINRKKYEIDKNGDFVSDSPDPELLKKTQTNE